MNWINLQRKVHQQHNLKSRVVFRAHSENHWIDTKEPPPWRRAPINISKERRANSAAKMFKQLKKEAMTKNHLLKEMMNLLQVKKA